MNKNAKKKEIYAPATTDKAGEAFQSFLNDIGISAALVSVESNDFTHKTIFRLINRKDFLSLERAFKALKFAFSSVYSNITLTSLLGGNAGADFAITTDNPNRKFVKLSEVKEKLTGSEFFLGVDEDTGEVVKGNLSDTPHLLIAGASGSGKSVLLNNIIKSFISLRWSDVAFWLIDTKRVEFVEYEAEKYKHDICQSVAKDYMTALRYLDTVCRVMDERYTEMAKRGEKLYSGTKWVIVIDEFADLILRGGSKLEQKIVKIAQQGRACGVHLVIATQRPTVEVCTGLIKANIPCRIALQCASKQDSRIILDQNGAELLRGKGEALYKADDGTIKKIQCFF